MLHKEQPFHQVADFRDDQGTGGGTADLCRKHGLSPARRYKLKAKFGGMDLSDARCLKQLEDENGKLKRLLADAMLDNVLPKGLAGKAMTTPMHRRDAVLRALRGHPAPQRRVCVLVGVDPKTVRRERPPDIPEIREAMLSKAVPETSTVAAG